MIEIRRNGRLTPQVPALDRGLQYGDGLFETISCVDGQPRWLERHLQRLALGCQRLKISSPDAALLRGEIVATARSTDRSMLKLIVTRGSAMERGYRPTGREQATHVLLQYPWPAATQPSSPWTT